MVITPETKLLIALYRKVQAIPYTVCKFDEKEINESLIAGDCRHKSHLLYILLIKSVFEVKKIKVIFDWKDLPLPHLLPLLKKSGTLRDHDSLQVKINHRWTNVDCTWDSPLEKIAFPVTKHWSGKTDTLQVTTGKLEFFDAKNYTKDKRIKIIKEEARQFAEALNDYFNKIRKKK